MDPNSKPKPEDHWSTEKYNKAASFVPQLTSKVLQYLDPQPNDKILDIGCGDGILTAKLAAKCARVVGLDSSPSFIKTAQEKVSSEHPNSIFREHDCRRLSSESEGQILRKNSYDKLFSNAAMHWILRDVHTRKTFFSDAWSLLKPDGVFAFEMGGAGNVAELHSTFIAVLHLQCGVPLERIHEADPWFFPSDAWMRAVLEDAGFVIEAIELEYRPTEVTPVAADGSGGLTGWIRLMGAQFLALLKEEERPKAVESMSHVLQSVVTRNENTKQYIGYVRLRACARKVERQASAV